MLFSAVRIYFIKIEMELILLLVHLLLVFIPVICIILHQVVYQPFLIFFLTISSWLHQLFPNPEDNECWLMFFALFCVHDLQLAVSRQGSNVIMRKLPLKLLWGLNQHQPLWYWAMQLELTYLVEIALLSELDCY